MFPRSTRLLCDEILAEARARGVQLEQESLTLELDLPVLRLRLGDRVFHGTRIRLPGVPGSSAYTPDVVTVHGSGFKTSRMWPRRLDGSFRVGAIVDHLLMTAQDRRDQQDRGALAVAHSGPTPRSDDLHAYLDSGAALGETTRVELPAELAQRTILLATAPSGELHLAAELIGSRDIVHLAEADDWQPSQVVTQRTLLDLEVDLAGVPHLWSLAGANSYFEAHRADDTWTEVLALAPDLALQTHFGLTRDGTTAGVGVRMVEADYQLSSRVVDESQDLGAPTPLYEYRVAPPATPGAPEDGPDLVFTHLHPDGLRVAWQAEPGLLVPKAAPLGPMCPIIILNEKNCPATCHDTAVGVEPGAFMVARTGDGRGWLAHLTTHLDHKVTYTPKLADILGDYCDGAVHDDHDTGVLHLYELGFDGAQPTERLALPIAAPAVHDLDNFGFIYTGADQRPLDLRAFASSLAIGLRTRDSATGVLAVRLLRFETAP